MALRNQRALTLCRESDVDTQECSVTLLIGLGINYRQNSVNQLLEKIVFDFVCRGAQEHTFRWLRYRRELLEPLVLYVSTEGKFQPLYQTQTGLRIYLCKGGVETMKKTIMYSVREDLSSNDCLLGWLSIENVDVYHI